MPAGKSLQPKSIKDTIEGEFDDHFLWLTEKHGRHTPEKTTAKYIIRKYLLKKNPDITSSQIEKYFTPHNVSRVLGLLEKFYKSKGVLAPKKSRRKASSRKTKSPRKSPKKSGSRKSAKESRRKSKSKESRGKSRGKSRTKRNKDKSSRSRK